MHESLAAFLGETFFLLLIFYKFFFTYIKLLNETSAKCYLDNKERLQTKARETYQSLSKEGKESNNMGVSDIQSLWRWKPKASWV